MPIQFNNSKRSFEMTRVKWERDTTLPNERDTYTELYLGPKGSGKSLLAVYRALLHHRGLKRNPATGYCMCGSSTCDGKWEVLTNLVSPTMPEYGAWAKPLDLANDILDPESPINHVIVLIDEITQYINSRQPTKREILKTINQATLLRKKKVKLWGTGISFDWIDKRMREQAQVLYSCWTPNQGYTVSALVHNLASGHLPPWKRQQMPKIRTWFTQNAKKFYNSWELVNADDEMAAARIEPLVYIKKGNQRLETNLSSLVAETVLELVKDGQETTTAQEIVDIIHNVFNYPASLSWVRGWLIESGFIKDQTGNFILTTEEKVGGSSG